MEIAGIGTEIVECLRIRRMIEQHGERFLLEIFSEAEVLFCQSRKLATEHFAARWATKEAILKALGVVGGKESRWTDIEIEASESGQPRVELRGGLKETATQKGIEGVLATHSFCRAYATATAIAWR
jgi:holo-[acyl-carrier protein] synthase